MVEAFVDGFRDAMLWSAWLFGLSCGLAVVLAVATVFRLGGEWGAFWWKYRRTPTRAEAGSGDGGEG